MTHIATVTIPASQVPADQIDIPIALPVPPSGSRLWSEATATGGTALVQGRVGPLIQVTIIPAPGATGTVSVSYRPPHCGEHDTGWEALQASDGLSDYAYDLSGGQRTQTFDGYAEALMIESDSGADFSVIVSG